MHALQVPLSLAAFRLAACQQVYILVPRMFRMWWRSPAMLMAEFAQYAFMAVLIGEWRGDVQGP